MPRETASERKKRKDKEFFYAKLRTYFSAAAMVLAFLMLTINFFVSLEILAR